MFCFSLLLLLAGHMFSLLFIGLFHTWVLSLVVITKCHHGSESYQCDLASPHPGHTLLEETSCTSNGQDFWSLVRLCICHVCIALDLRKPSVVCFVVNPKKRLWFYFYPYSWNKECEYFHTWFKALLFGFSAL
jgi:hypothetical protein